MGLRTTGCLLITVLIDLAAPLGAATPPAATPRPEEVATLARAEAQLAAGDAAGVLTAVAPLLARQPRQPRALYLRGTARCMEGQTAACRADLEQAVALDPLLRPAWLNLAGLAVADKRWDDALAAFTRAEGLDPAAADNDLNLGATLLLAGRLQEAAQRFERYAARDPRAAEARFRIAKNYALAGYAALAARELERAIALDETSRVRARFDPNFADLLVHPAFVPILEVDRYQVPAGYLVERRSFDRPYDGPTGKLLAAVLDTVQLSGRRFDPRVDATANWAVLWTDFRVKIATATDGRGVVELTAPPTAFTPATWQQETARFYAEVARRLLLSQK
jgi:tetratricopeptide (TPR) repeat protein